MSARREALQRLTSGSSATSPWRWGSPRGSPARSSRSGARRAGSPTRSSSTAWASSFVHALGTRAPCPEDAVRWPAPPARSESTVLRRSLERIVATAAHEVQVLGDAARRVDAPRERARARRRAHARTRPLAPRWTYAPVDEGRSPPRAGRRGASALVRETRPARRALPGSRARAVAGGRALRRGRHGGRRPAGARPVRSARAQRPARPPRARETWLAEPAPPAPTATLPSDADDPRSLLALMRAAVGRLRLPFTVVAQPSLASLAATGDGVMLVAPGRAVAGEDAARTVLHEIEGHALPRARARAARLWSSCARGPREASTIRRASRCGSRSAPACSGRDAGDSSPPGTAPSRP